MARLNYLQRRGARYWVRVRIPSDLLDAFDGRKEIIRALGTSDPAIARERCIVMTGRINALLLQIRVEMDEELRRAIARQIYEENLRQDDARRHGGAQKRSQHSRAKELRKVGASALTMLAAGDYGDNGFIDRKALEIIASLGLSIEEGSADFIAVRSAILRGLQEGYRRQVERDAGDFSGVPSDSLLTAIQAQTPIVAPIAQPAPASIAIAEPSGESIGELFEKYLALNPGRMKPASLETARKSFELLLATLPGPNFPANNLKKTHIRDWRLLLGGYPSRALHMKEFANLSFIDIVERNKSIKKPLIADLTINKHLSFISGFCGWLVTNCWIESNPVDDMFKNVDRDEKVPVPFSIDHIRLLFASPLYMGCVADELSWHKPGTTHHSDHRYWAPLIGLFSGLRLGEIAQLRLEDIRDVDGVIVFDINRDGGKTTKTKDSIRVVPVHKSLIDNGLMKYISRMEISKNRLLFPIMRDGDRDNQQLASKYSRSFGRFLVKSAIKIPRLCFHSTRHSFTDALRRAGYLEAEISLLTGHSREQITTARYGTEMTGTISKRAEMINSIAYAGVVLPDPWKG